MAVDGVDRMRRRFGRAGVLRSALCVLVWTVLTSSCIDAYMLDTNSDCLSSESGSALYAWLNTSKPLSCFRWQRPNRTQHVAGSVVIGALIPLYRTPAQSDNSIVPSLPCSVSTGQIGIQLVESLIQSVEEELVQNALADRLVSAVEIRDTCVSMSYCAKQASHFVSRTPHAKRVCSANDSVAARTLPPSSLTPGTSGSQLCAGAQSRVPIVIGPSDTTVLKISSDELSANHLPHIGYWESSENDRDTTTDPYLFRTVPSSRYQARALVELLGLYNWSYISVIGSSHDSLDGGLLNLFKLAVEEYNLNPNVSKLCIYDEQISSFAGPTQVNRIAEWSANQTKSNVTILLAGSEYVRALFSALRYLSSMPLYRAKLASSHHVWIGVSDWIWSLEDTLPLWPTDGSPLAGHHTFITFVMNLPGEFHSTTAEFNNRMQSRFSAYTGVGHALRRNPWLAALWTASKAECTQGDHTSQNCFAGRFSPSSMLREIMKPLVLPVRSGSLTVAARAAVRLVNTTLGQCLSAECLWQFSGSHLSEALLSNVTLPCENGSCSLFSSNQEVPPSFTIANLQIFQNELSVKTVGHWTHSSSSADRFSWFDCNGPSLDGIKEPCFMWGLDFENKTTSWHIPRSACAQQCRPGQYRYFNESDNIVSAPCCWSCEDCSLRDMVSSEPREPCTLCKKAEGEIPSAEFTHCVLKEPVYRKISEPVTIVMATLGSVAAVLVLVSIILLFLQRKTTIAHITHHRFSMILLVLLCISFLWLPFSFVKPNEVSCTFRSLVNPAIVWCTTVALLLRVLHLAYENGERCECRPVLYISTVCCSSFRRLFSTLAITCAACLLPYIIFRVVQPKDVDIFVIEENRIPQRILHCLLEWTDFLQFGIEFAFLLLTDVIAFLSRKLRGGYSEAMLLMFCSFALTVEWIVLIVLVFVDQRNRDLGIGIVIFCHMATIFGCLYAPRIYIVLFRSRRNAPHTLSRSSGLRFNPTVSSASLKKPVLKSPTTDEESSDPQILVDACDSQPSSSPAITKETSL
ncbi:metabotropic glutamate receptor 8-like [Sycon ciliatum]|uniref:metabotropic glutamate receptor 8-like n=1 Tax=Sycon ciliatum TaxID=27933 RepID=UPI0031F67F1D